MSIEIERKFLVLHDRWKANASHSIFKQAYLNSTPERTVRIRVDGDQAFITIKSKNTGILRQEFEYSIPADDAENLFLLCETPAIEKIRYRVTYGHHIWEIDEFTGMNKGLVIAEIELQNENESFDKPEWLGAEVSDDHRYFNSYLSRHPYTTW